ncbi:hypothetical protein [Thauera sinica]|uniref:Uncharacterized protein n=1 Tax=Thauera sinica TaxID=2665146 RepID=A0ABW1ATH5_9RHOO|nr:hypothetical protein [Thauera sp. K11]ATE58831.1 hypothetical protein CCZ27_01650 [Thauera sp. K11]
MCFFDSPIGRCEAVRELVLLDETQKECACEHGCPPGFECPLEGCFATVSGISEETAEVLAARETDAAVVKAASRRIQDAIAA